MDFVDKCYNGGMIKNVLYRVFPLCIGIGVVIGFSIMSIVVYAHTNAKYPYQVCSTLDPNKFQTKDYGVPYNVFSKTREIYTFVLCGANDIKVKVNPVVDQYVYEQGYVWNGSEWESFIFEGYNENKWMHGNIEAIIPFPHDQQAGINFVLAYTCTRIGPHWKCGCSDESCQREKWELLTFSSETIEPELTKVFDAVEKALNPPPIMIKGLTVKEVSPGDILGVSQLYGFTAHDNTIVLQSNANPNEGYTIPNLSMINSGVSAPIPANIPYGIYTVGARNSNGASAFMHYVVIRPRGTVTPVLSTISKDTVVYGDTVTVTGTGFTKTGNEIHTKMGIIKDIPSPDGTTMTFSMAPQSDTLIYMDEAVANPDINGKYFLRMAVINTNGISTTLLPITITY